MIIKKIDTFFGFNMPFNGGPQNILSRQVDDKLIKNDIKQLLLTVPGERVMRPEFGVPLRTFLFEGITPTDLATLESQIIAALTVQEPRVVIENVSVVEDENKNGIKVTVVVRLVKDLKQVLVIEHFLNQSA